METIVRPLQPSDETTWRELWRQYCTFYGQTLAPETTATLWARLLSPAMVIHGAGAVRADTGELVGVAHYVLHPHTWSEKTLCYLEDLFVAPEARGQNVGHTLISHLVAMAKEHGWGRVYWHTEMGNTPARRLYDRFTTADDIVRYTMTLR